RRSLRADATVCSQVRKQHRRDFVARFPMLEGVELEFTWGGVMGATFNGAQSFGRLAPNLYAAGGYNGVGIAMGTISGRLLADPRAAARGSRAGRGLGPPRRLAGAA